jgi:hypothetical protein
MQYRLVSAAPADGEVFVEISLTDPRFSRGYDDSRVGRGLVERA